MESARGIDQAPRGPATAKPERHRPRAEALGLRLVKPIRGQVLNLSPLGIAIESKTALRVGREYTLVLQRGFKRRQLKGRVVWCALKRTRRLVPGTVEPVYRAGVAIEALHPDAWRFLQASMRSADA